VRQRKISPKVKQNVVVLFLLTVVQAAQPAPAGRELLRLEQSAEAMGSAYSIAVYGYDRDQMEAAVGAAFDEVRQLDSMLSNYKPDSEWSEVNREAGRRPVQVSPELF
jgi:thiamine biosynthesis lipoprotein